MAEETDQGEQEGFIAFLKDTWIWWLAPIVIAVLLAIALVVYSEDDATSPFIYDNF